MYKRANNSTWEGGDRELKYIHVLHLFHWYFVVCTLQREPHILYAAHGYMKPHMHNNKEMAFDYMKVSTSIF